MDKRIFRLALPNIITNVTVPLLGIIDIAIAGRLGSPVYIGATASKEMRDAMLLASLLFFVTYFALTPVWGNNGLWFSFILYLFVRGVVQTLWAKRALTLEHA